MPAPLSLDLRKRIVQAVGRGCSIREAARRFAVAPSTALKLMQRVEATGSPAPARYGGHRRPLLEPFEGEIRADWQGFMDPTRFIFLDETATTTAMARRYGRRHQGARLVAAVPHGHWKTTTFIAGLRASGVIAPLVLDGPMTGPAFRAYVEQFLAPALKTGDVVVLDNLSAHKVDGVRQAIVRAGASILYLPPYTPT